MSTLAGPGGPGAMEVTLGVYLAGPGAMEVTLGVYLGRTWSHGGNPRCPPWQNLEPWR